MKTLSLVVLSVILSVAASPLGDRAVFRRHKGVPLSRRHMLQSRTDAPAACAALAPPPPSSTSTAPDLSSTGLPPVDPTATANATDPSLASNTTVAAPTTTVNSTTSTNSTATRRFWSRHDSSFGFGDTSFSSSHVVSVSVSFEETISTFVQTWEDLCLESGGDIFTGDPCVNLAGDYGIEALSEYADPCDQLDIADRMITFAKSRGIRNKDALIKFAQGFRAHPRNAVEVLGVIPSSLYCLRAPINPELSGIYNQQIDGVNPGLFGSPSAPMVPFGSSGTCPLGMSADMSTCGCTGGSDATSTDTAALSIPTDSTSTDTADLTTPTEATSTDTANITASTDATSTDTADASAATDTSTDTTGSSTDTAAAAAATDANVSPTDTATGPNFQPTDISGNVNDPAGRR